MTVYELLMDVTYRNAAGQLTDTAYAAYLHTQDIVGFTPKDDLDLIEVIWPSEF